LAAAPPSFHLKAGEKAWGIPMQAADRSYAHHFDNPRFKWNGKTLMCSVYGLPFKEFPVKACTNQKSYLDWCIQVSGMMPHLRSYKDFQELISNFMGKASEEKYRHLYKITKAGLDAAE
jgi:hypothetical protein